MRSVVNACQSHLAPLFIVKKTNTYYGPILYIRTTIDWLWRQRGVNTYAVELPLFS